MTGFPGPGGVRPSMPTPRATIPRPTSGSSAVRRGKRPARAVGRHGRSASRALSPARAVARAPATKPVQPQLRRDDGRAGRDQRGGLGAGSPSARAGRASSRVASPADGSAGGASARATIARGEEGGEHGFQLVRAARAQDRGCKTSVKVAIVVARTSGSGANLGDREATLRRALELLGERVSRSSPSRHFARRNRGGTPTSRRSSTLRRASTPSCPPRELLDALLEVERDLGRTSRRAALRPAHDRPRSAALRRRGGRRAGSHGAAPAAARAPLRPRAAGGARSGRSSCRAAAPVADLLDDYTEPAMSHLDELDEFEAELELELKREYTAVFGLFRYCVLTQDATYLCNKLELKVVPQASYPFFHIQMEDVWVWDKNRPTRIIPRAEVYTSGDVTVEELRGEGDEPKLTAEALAERIGEPLPSDDEPAGCLTGRRTRPQRESHRCSPSTSATRRPRSASTRRSASARLAPRHRGAANGRRARRPARRPARPRRGRGDLPRLHRSDARPRVGAARGALGACAAARRRPGREDGASRFATTIRARSVPTGSSTRSPPRSATARP